MVKLETEFNSLTHLYRSYMPFIRYGGMFFVSNHEYQLGRVVKARFCLPDEDEWHEIEGPVVWVNPLGSQGGRPPGVGIAFTEEDNPHKPAIEQLLAGMLGSNQLTSTM